MLKGGECRLMSPEATERIESSTTSVGPPYDNPILAKVSALKAGKKIPSWGVWPGAVSLPRHFGNSGSQPGFTRRGPGRGTSSQNREEKRCYLRKDRILFTGKPPTLAKFVTPKDKKDPWEWLSSHILLVAGLAWSINDCDIRDSGRGYGDIRAIRVLSDPNTGTSLGLALVEFISAASVDIAMSTNGEAWGEKQGSDIKMFRIDAQLTRQLFSLNVDMDTWQPHWGHGAWIPDVTIASLKMIANSISKVAKPPMADTTSTNVALQSPSHLEIDSDSKDVFRDQEQGKKQISDHYKLKFPFAAAAIVATNLLKELQENKERKRQRRGVEVIDDGRKRRRSIEDDEDFSYLDNLDMSYEWPQSRLYTLPKIPLDISSFLHSNDVHSDDLKQTSSNFTHSQQMPSRYPQITGPQWNQRLQTSNLPSQSQQFQMSQTFQHIPIRASTDHHRSSPTHHRNTQIPFLDSWNRSMYPFER